MAYLKFLPCYPDVTPQLVRKGRDHSLCLRKAGREFLSQVCLWPPKRYLYQLHFEMCLGNTGKQFFSPRHPLKPHHHTHHWGSRSGNLRGTRSYNRFQSSNIRDDLTQLLNLSFQGSQQPEPVSISDSSPCDILQKGLWTQRGELLRLSWRTRPHLNSGMGPALPHFSRERAKGDALTYRNGHRENSQAPASFRSGPLLAVTSGKYYQILANIKLF